jgi:Protein of unknown function (DUF3800)
MMTCYFDESANSSTIACGGWIGFDSQWDKISRDWSARVQHESRINQKHKLKPITRYHASDCANRLRQFSGWDVSRQIRFTKKLHEIMAGETATTKCRVHDRPMIFGWAVSVADARETFKDDLTEMELKRYCYSICVHECLKEVERVARVHYPDETINVVHDRGGFADAAVRAVNNLMGNKNSQLATVSLTSWDQCVPLQCADMVAYDVFKSMGKRFSGSEEIRKSLAAIVAKGVPIVVGGIRPDAFKLMRTWMVRDGVLKK